MKFEDFEITPGNKKILISAPHAVEQTRDNAIKFAEKETAVIAKQLNKLGYPTIIKTRNLNNDANYDLEIDSTYKQELLKFCKENDIAFVLDLHQLSSKREMDFCLGTGDEYNRNLLSHTYLLNEVSNIITKNNFTFTINKPFTSSSPKTISGFCQTKNIPSMQLEINSKLVADYCNGTQLNAVIEMIANICGLIETEL